MSLAILFSIPEGRATAPNKNEVGIFPLRDRGWWGGGGCASLASQSNCGRAFCTPLSQGRKRRSDDDEEESGWSFAKVMGMMMMQQRNGSKARDAELAVCHDKMALNWEESCQQQQMMNMMMMMMMLNNINGNAAAAGSLNPHLGSSPTRGEDTDDV